MTKPIKFIPATKSYIWGGTGLREHWGKTAETATIAECWELSAYPGSESIACTEHPGMTLSDLLRTYPAYFGHRIRADRFPILIKLIDAAKDLSVQVHPTDDYAAVHEGGEAGKTEMWYIADARPDAAIYYGFSRDVSRDEVAERIRHNTITDLLRRVPVQKGDAFFVPAGTVHALLSGVTVIEIQQSSNLTYRVYDYDRRDADGNPRPLHIDKALDVLNYASGDLPAPNSPQFIAPGVEQRLLATCPYFTTHEVKLTGGTYAPDPRDTFLTFTAADGCGTWDSGEPITRGETWLIPCECHSTITGEGLTLVVTSV